MPQIRACADEIDARRELPRPLFEALADAGMFHLAVPHVLGGAELDLPTYVHVIEEIGKADASTGWCVNQGAIFATYSARMPREVFDGIRWGLERGPVLVQTPRVGYAVKLACERCRTPARCGACAGPLELTGPTSPPRCPFCLKIST